jgi:hypothetical protein
MKLITSLAPAKAEVEPGVVAKADQKFLLWFNKEITTTFVICF